MNNRITFFIISPLIRECPPLALDNNQPETFSAFSIKFIQIEPIPIGNGFSPVTGQMQFAPGVVPGYYIETLNR
jgi:hypothetical protein